MIDKMPTPGDMTDYLMEPYSGGNGASPMTFDRPSERVSALLGPDGEPLLVGIPRVRLGFDLTRRLE